jgi:hypothetical protein
MVDVYIFSMVLPGCYLFPAVFCYFSFSFYALACVSSKLKYLVAVMTLHYHANINAKVCFSSQIINEEKEGDGSSHEGTR